MRNAALVCLILFAISAGCMERKQVHFSESEIRNLAQTGAPIVDVRTTSEYGLGHVVGSTNIPIDELNQRIALVASNKKSPIILHCQSGGRSAAAKQTLEKLGYYQVIDLGSLSNARKVLGDLPK